MDNTYTYHTDPGHGWVEVPMLTINDLGLADKISEYSYRNGDKVYLEEDCDASLFINALKDLGLKYSLVTQYREHTPIRRYKRYKS